MEDIHTTRESRKEHAGRERNCGSRAVLSATLMGVILAGWSPMAGAADPTCPQDNREEVAPDSVNNEARALFRPPGLGTCDVWFAVNNGVYHAFFLQFPEFARGHSATGFPHVGLATSSDLWSWQYHGPVLVPLHDTWNDVAIATGSTVACNGKWWLVYSGHSSTDSGMGLASSDDLMHWQKVGDGPLVSFGRQKFDGQWQREAVEWYAIADPYILPDPVDGWYYAIFNAGIVGQPGNARGCIAAMRSKDIENWEPWRVLSWPKWFDRMETPQIWERGGRWYLYFGAAHDSGINETFVEQSGLPAGRAQRKRDNFVFVADTFAGPYRPRGKWWIDLPDNRHGYIMKVIRDPNGHDVLITTTEGCLSDPYPVTYADDGSLILHRP